MLIFFIGVICLFIPPYGWIISITLAVVTFLYYVTGADMVKEQQDIQVRVIIDGEETGGVKPKSSSIES